MKAPVVVVDVQYTTMAGARVRERSTLRQARYTLRALEARQQSFRGRPDPKTWDEGVKELEEYTDLHEQIEAYRSALHRAGYCRACGRRLTDTVSVGYGYGPDCRAKLDTGDRA